MRRDERGSAIVESVFGMFVLLFLAVGTIQVALTLYARNILQAAVHDGSRAAVEIGGRYTDTDALVRGIIDRSAGGLVDDLRVETTTEEVTDRLKVEVRAYGALTAPGPIPIRLGVVLESTSSREIFDAP